jgi:hypothetical protein
MSRESVLKIGDRVILVETPEIYGVIVHKHNLETAPIKGDTREWGVHWYNAPRYHKNIRCGKGVYEEQQLKKENNFKKDDE